MRTIHRQPTQPTGLLVPKVRNQIACRIFSIALTLLAAGVTAQAANIGQGPDPREIPLPPIQTSLGTMPGPAQLPSHPELPAVLTLSNGTPVKTAEQWKQRRQEMKRILSYYAVGLMPPAPGNVKGREVQSQTVLNGQVLYRLVHLTFGPGEKLELNIGIFTPAGKGPFPSVILPGSTPPGAAPLPTQAHPPGQGHGVDALLPVLPSTNSDDTVSRSRPPHTAESLAQSHQDLFQRGYALVVFNHNDCAEDTTLRNADGSWAFRSTRFFPAYPGCDWGVLAGWAWGVSRIVDYLQTDPLVDKSKLIITGVSRLGKSAMVTAAFDDRIAMAAPCVTGGGGMPAYRFSGEGRGGKESLAEMMRKYPNWFSPHLHDFWGQVEKLPFDEHWFIALAAPRPFLALEGFTDPVSLAPAVKKSWENAQPAYAFCKASDHLGIHYSAHGHTMDKEDWTALMDFADKYLRGLKVDRRFDQFPPDSAFVAPASPPASPK